MFTRYLRILLKAHLWMVKWSWKVLFIYEIISSTLLTLIQFVMLVFGIHSLLLGRILSAKRLILFAKMWSLICYERIFNINKNNVNDVCVGALFLRAFFIVNLRKVLLLAIFFLQFLAPTFHKNNPKHVKFLKNLGFVKSYTRIMIIV